LPQSQNQKTSERAASPSCSVEYVCLNKVTFHVRQATEGHLGGRVKDKGVLAACPPPKRGVLVVVQCRHGRVVEGGVLLFYLRPRPYAVL